MRSLIGLMIALAAGVCLGAEAYKWVDEKGVVIRLQQGMTEGELLVRAGRPDHETLDNLVDYDRTLYYFPTVANPYTTVVKLRSGRIAYLDRVKKF